VAARRILDGEHPPSSLHILRCLHPVSTRISSPIPMA
jgi:hypothetical protein